MDTQSVYTTRTFASNYTDTADSATQVRAQIEEFILSFRLENNYVYRLVAQLLSVIIDGILTVIVINFEKMPC